MKNCLQGDSLKLWIINAVWEIFIFHWQTCFYMQIFPEVWTFWYLAFKVTKKSFLVQIEVFGEKFWFLNISENTKENLTNFLDWFYFCFHFREFISLSRYSELWKVMPQIKEPVLNKFNQIEWKIQEIIFFENLEF